MKLYHYDKDTKEYVGSSDARLDPLESQKQGKDIFLIPANATVEAPLAIPAGKVPIINKGAWVLVNTPETPEEKPHVETPEELAVKEKAEQKALLRAEIQAELESTETKTIAALKVIMLKLLDVTKEI